MTFNQQLIEKARKGEIAILNDGSVEELRKVLIEVWPDDKVSKRAEGCDKYYYRDTDEIWEADEETSLPAHSVKDFFMNTKDKAIEELKGDLEWMDKNKEQPRTYRVTPDEISRIVKALPLADNLKEYADFLDWVAHSNFVFDINIGWVSPIYRVPPGNYGRGWTSAQVFILYKLDQEKIK